MPDESRVIHFAEADPSRTGRGLRHHPGRGVLLHEGRRESFEAGDFFFVAAGTEHRFEDFSEDVAYSRILRAQAESVCLDKDFKKIQANPRTRGVRF